MGYGLMVVVDCTESSESESRLFRKKRKKLEKRTKLKSIKKGIYFIPFENPEPSEKERDLFTQILLLMQKFHVKAKFFHVTEFDPLHDLMKFNNGVWTIKSEYDKFLVLRGTDGERKITKWITFKQG